MVPPAAVLTLATILDRALGEPPTRFHPVGILGRFVGWWGRPALYPVRLQRGAGLVMWAATVAIFSLPFFAFELLARGWLYLILAPLLLKVLFAWRSLEEHAAKVAECVQRSMEEARQHAGMMVSRDTAGLGKEHLLSAAYESLSENLVDSITAPLLFFFAGEVLIGCGLGCAAIYRAANTMDAMLGYRDERERLGWAAARMDDILNLLPARITGAFMLLYFAARGRGEQAWNVFRRDAGRRPGMNGGIPMAIMAGGMGVAFEKPGVYRIGISERTLEEAGPELVRESRRIIALFILILAAALFLLAGAPNI